MPIKFTPISRKTGQRIEMEIIEPPSYIPRGKHATFTVTDKKTGKKYRCRTRSCDLPGCLCDASIDDRKPCGGM